MNSEEIPNSGNTDKYRTVVRYTHNELSMLISDFPKLSGSFIVGEKGLLIEDNQFFGYVFLDPELDPATTLLSYCHYHETEIQLLAPIRDLIYYTPLHRVALYMNSYPGIVNWRLKIGK